MEAIPFHFWNRLTELRHCTKYNLLPLHPQLFLFMQQVIGLATQNNSDALRTW